MLELERLNCKKQTKRKRSAKTPEGKVKEQIKEILDTYGAYWFMPVTGGYNRSGVPDFILCHRGAFIAVEAKSKHTSHGVTALQQLNMEQINKAGGISIVIDEDNISTLHEILQGVEK